MKKPTLKFRLQQRTLCFSPPFAGQHCVCLLFSFLKNSQRLLQGFRFVIKISFSATVDKTKFSDGINKIFKDKNYLLLLLAFSLILGNFNTFATLINDII
jgi:hypothetical protein